MKYKGFLYKMLVHDLLKRPLAIRPVPSSSYPYIPIPSISIYSHLWPLGGVEPWECSGSPKLVSLVVLGLFVDKHEWVHFPQDPTGIQGVILSLQMLAGTVQ